MIDTYDIMNHNEQRKASYALMGLIIIIGVNYNLLTIGISFFDAILYPFHRYSTAYHTPFEMAFSIIFMPLVTYYGVRLLFNKPYYPQKYDMMLIILFWLLRDVILLPRLYYSYHNASFCKSIYGYHFHNFILLRGIVYFVLFAIFLFYTHKKTSAKIIWAMPVSIMLTILVLIASFIINTNRIEPIFKDELFIAKRMKYDMPLREIFKNVRANNTSEAKSLAKLYGDKKSRENNKCVSCIIMADIDMISSDCSRIKATSTNCISKMAGNPGGCAIIAQRRKEVMDKICSQDMDEIWGNVAENEPYWYRRDMLYELYNIDYSKHYTVIKYEGRLCNTNHIASKWTCLFAGITMADDSIRNGQYDIAIDRLALSKVTADELDSEPYLNYIHKKAFAMRDQLCDYKYHSFLSDEEIVFCNWLDKQNKAHKTRK